MVRDSLSMSVLLSRLSFQVDMFMSLIQGVVRMSAIVSVGFAGSV